MRDFYISEQNYLTDMKEKVLPFINSFRIEGVFKGYDDKDIHFVKYIIVSKIQPPPLSYRTVLPNRPKSGTNSRIIF